MHRLPDYPVTTWKDISGILDRCAAQNPLGFFTFTSEPVYVFEVMDILVLPGLCAVRRFYRAFRKTGCKLFIIRVLKRGLETV